MSCAVGNDAARDAQKHSAAFILRAAIAAIVPAAGTFARCPSPFPRPSPLRLHGCGAVSPRGARRRVAERVGVWGWGGGSRPGHNVACFMLALCPLCAGDMQSVHYDKRGAKITIGYDGDDCGGKKDEVEQAANKICAENTAMASVRLCMCTRVHAAPCVPDFDCMFAHSVPRPADDASHAHVPTLAPARLK